MEKNKRLSIVVYLKNTDEKIFDECLKSIFESTLTSKEVVLVDDGSSKDYSKILKKYKFEKIIKLENKGKLQSIIAGIEASSGEYVSFIKSEDVISFAYYEAMCVCAQKTKAEIVFNDRAFLTNKCRYFCDADPSISKNFNYQDDYVLERFFAQSGEEQSFYALENKIYKADILKETIKKIAELDIQKIQYAEDILISYFAFSLSKKLTNVHLGYYFCRVQDEDKIDSKEKLKEYIESTALVFDYIKADLQKNNKYEKYQNDFLEWTKLLTSYIYTFCKKAKYLELYDLLKDKFHTEKLKTKHIFYNKSYSNQKVLPQNINEIDTFLKKVYYSNKYLKVYTNRFSYAMRELAQIKTLFGLKFVVVKNKKDSNLIFPKAKYSIIQFLLHNVFECKKELRLLKKSKKEKKEEK